MSSFDFQPITRMIFGPDTLDQLGALARELGGSRVMVVSDAGVIAAGHAPRGVTILQEAGLETLLFEGVHENPTTKDVEDGLVVAREFSPDLIVGLGGGSSMDCAKGINFLFSCGGKIQDYWGKDKATGPLLPMIAVPTTSGTGSETQSYALISDAETHVKMACGDKRAAFKVAVLDPKLTLTQPEQVTALTGIDAIAHALETYVTTARNPVSLAFSREAWRLLSTSFAKVLDDPNDLDARSGMQLGASFAGLAIENSMLGAMHALANPLTASYGTVHGQAISVMLPHVVRYNGQQYASWYHELYELTSANGLAAAQEAPERLAQQVTDLIEKAGLATRLSALGVEREKLPELAAGAATQWTGNFNPRQVGEPEFLSLYEAAFE